MLTQTLQLIQNAYDRGKLVGFTFGLFTGWLSLSLMIAFFKWVV